MTQLTWLVTGCSSGIGEALVREILARGDVAIATARGVVSRLEELKELGAKTFSLDVTGSLIQTKAIVEKILEEHPIDVLVNNAGYIEAGLCEEISIDHYINQFETNFFGVVKTTQAVLPHFRGKKYGTIAFIGSSGGVAGEPGGGPYCSTKFALEGWHDCLKKEIAHLNIRSMIFELGNFRTKVMHPNNIRFRPQHISDYDDFRNGLEQFIRAIDGNQSGDTEKAVEIIVDLVKGEGVATGNTVPDRFPIGSEILDVIRKRSETELAVCSEWEDVIRSADLKP